MTRINSNVLAKARATKPEYDSMTAHLSRLIELGLDSGLTLTKGLEPRSLYNNNIENKKNKEKSKSNFTKTSKALESTEKRDPFASKVLKPELIPKDLQDCSELFIEWWAARHKKGATCSSKIAEREFSKLRAWNPQKRLEAIQKAIYKPWMQLYAVTDTQAAEVAASGPRLPDYTGIAAKQREEAANNGVLGGMF